MAITNFSRGNGGGGGGTIATVNGQTGVVTIRTADVPLTTPLAQYPVAADIDVALQQIAADVALAGQTDTFTSALNSITNTGDNVNLILDINPTGLSSAITGASAAEIAALTATSEVLANVGGQIKKIPMSAVGGTPDTFVSTNATIINSGADAHNLDLDVSMAGIASVAQNTTVAENAAVTGTTTILADIGGVIKKLPLSVAAPGGTPDTFVSTGGTVVNAGADGANLDLDVAHDVLFERPATLTAGELALFAGSEEIWVQLSGGAVRQMTMAQLFSQAPPDLHLDTLGFDTTTGVLTGTMSDTTTVTVDLDGRYIQTLNAVGPDAVGNVPLSLTAVETGDVASRPAAPADATIYVVSNNTADPTQNGKTFIYQTASAQWYEIVGYDVASMDARYINNAGDTMLGQLVLNADPTVAMEAATKQYVDAQSLNTFASTGGTIIQSGADAKNLDLDVNTAALNALIPVATAAEITTLTATDEIYANVGGVMKRIPLSAVGTDDQTAAEVNLVTSVAANGFPGTTVDAVIAQMAAKIDWITNPAV